MAKHVCPFWVGYLLASPLRKLIQNPYSILKPHIKKGMTVLDVGCAMGFFSLPMAEIVKPEGKVICVDIQDRMINVLEKKLKKAGLINFVETEICSQSSLNINKFNETFDFALAYAVLHETSDQSHFLFEISQALKPGGKLLLAEPKGHVSVACFERSFSLANTRDFKITGQPKIFLSHAVLLEKPGN